MLLWIEIESVLGKFKLDAESLFVDEVVPETENAEANPEEQ